MNNPEVQLTRCFLKTGIEILGVNPASSNMTTVLDAFKYNFKYSPSRCAFIYIRLLGNPLLPDEYQPKHLLWTIYFLLTYGTERRLCHILRADRKTIRKYTWSTIAAIASLEDDYVSDIRHRVTVELCLTSTYWTLTCADLLGESVHWR